MQKEIAEFNKQDKTQIIEGKHTKSWFFEAINKINKSQLQLKKKRERENKELISEEKKKELISGIQRGESLQILARVTKQSKIKL